MSHAHHWVLNQKGFGVCIIPGCEAECQFSANTWKVKQTDPLRRPLAQVAKEVAALNAQYRTPWVKAVRGRFNVKDSKIRQK